MSEAAIEGGRSRRLAVLQSVRPDAPKVNPYVPLLLESLSRYVNAISFTWKTALWGRYDVFHVHWPEGLYSSPSWSKSVLKKVLTGLLLIRLRLGRRPIVQTLHNINPHMGQSRVDQLFRSQIDRLTAGYIALNRHTPSPEGSRVSVIPHGHYVDWLEDFDKHPSDESRVLFFGIIRRYKNVLDLIRVVGSEEGPTVDLHVAGFPAEASYRREIEQAVAESSQKVHLNLQHLDDRELTHEITAAQLVVLPYSEMHNSGALLLALSLGRPVLVPRNPITVDLVKEVGDKWVFAYEPPLTPETLRQALAWSSSNSQSSASPCLDLRDWDVVAKQTARALRAAVETT